MKYLYKYPQAAYPYADLVRTNRSRSLNETEYELIDTGVFNDDRYFDVFIEYAKESPEDILIKISVVNRGPEAAPLHVLPTLWFRNTWSWYLDAQKPVLKRVDSRDDISVVSVSHPELGERCFYCEGNAPLLFTENETNTERIFGIPNQTPYVKDAINNYLVHGHTNAVNPEGLGTKVAGHYKITVGAGETKVIRLRLTNVSLSAGKEKPFSDFDKVVNTRLREADEFYRSITPEKLNPDAANVMRQALAGMLWSKQFYHYDVRRWLKERDSDPLASVRRPAPRNESWYHMVNEDIISMPDKWEYPWYAAWDLAFHTVVLQMVAPDFAKEQLDLMLREHYLHPSGQIPAYEWNFGDVNPPRACLGFHIHV